MQRSSWGKGEGVDWRGVHIEGHQEDGVWVVCWGWTGGLGCGCVSAVVAVVIGPAGGGGGVRPVVVFPQGCGVVGGGVHVGLLKRRWIEVGPLVWQEIVLVQGLKDGRMYS